MRSCANRRLRLSNNWVTVTPTMTMMTKPMIPMKKRKNRNQKQIKLAPKLPNRDKIYQVKRNQMLWTTLWRRQVKTLRSLLKSKSPTKIKIKFHSSTIQVARTAQALNNPSLKLLLQLLVPKNFQNNHSKSKMLRTKMILREMMMMILKKVRKRCLHNRWMLSSQAK